MKSNIVLLIKTYFVSTSGWNILKHSSDKAKRNRALANIIGYGIVGVVLFGYCMIYSIGMMKFGMTSAIPSICAEMIVLMTFVFTLLKSNGYLFGFKEYGMIMSMPFKEAEIVISKFTFMYIKSLAITMGISVSMLVGYILGIGFDISVIAIWIGISIILPILPTVLASFLGAIVVKLSINARRKQLFQALAMMCAILPFFFFMMLLSYVSENDNLDVIVNSVVSKSHSIGDYIPNVFWFEDAIVKKDALAMVWLLVASVAMLIVFFIFTSKSYIKVNSRLAVGRVHKVLKEINVKTNSMVKAIVFKEWKKLTGSSIYMINMLVGYVLVLLLSIVVCFVDVNEIVERVLGMLEISQDALAILIPLIVYYMVGLASTTCCSPSLEGKNYWIIKSLPISTMTDYNGKMLFNICLQVPFAVIGVVALSVAVGVDIGYIITAVILEILMCCFSTAFGLVCGVKFRRLDWDNEYEVVKQGMAVMLYMVPNLIFTAMVMGAIIFLAKIINVWMEFILVFALYIVLTVVSLVLIKAFAKRGM